MLLRAYSIYDRKSLAYFPPFYAMNDAVAVRSFSELVGDPNTNVGRHPNDFVLYRIGGFDDSKAELLGEVPIAHVIDGNSLVQALQQEIPFPPNATERKAS